MIINDDIRKLTVGKADSNQIRKKAVENGMRPLRDDGWLKVRQGTIEHCRGSARHAGSLTLM